MKNVLKYNEFYYKTNGEIISVYKLDKNTYLSYENAMFCPDCNQAELYFVLHSKTPHLRTKPSATHCNQCPYNYEEANNKITQKYFDALSETQMQNKLNAIMRYLCTDKHTRKAYLTDSTIEQNPMLIPSNTQKTKTYYMLRRKSLAVYFSEEDKNQLYIFYGKAKLKVINKQNYAFLKIGIGKKPISIYFSKAHIPKDIKENATYHIVCIGYLEDSVFNIELLKPNSIKYQKID